MQTYKTTIIEGIVTASGGKLFVNGKAEDGAHHLDWADAVHIGPGGLSYEPTSAPAFDG